MDFPGLAADGLERAGVDPVTHLPLLGAGRLILDDDQHIRVVQRLFRGDLKGHVHRVEHAFPGGDKAAPVKVRARAVGDPLHVHLGVLLGDRLAE